MSRRKGARLYLRTPKRGHPYYVIRDSGRPDVSTRTGDLRDAEAALATYIAERDRPKTVRQPEDITVAEVLTIYAEDRGPTVVSRGTLGYSIQALLPFWGRLHASDVGGPNCRKYIAYRNRKPGTIRRELGVLQAALNHASIEKHITHAPRVTRPAATETHQRALTRTEVARLLRAARARGDDHVARFILISVYTGTRMSATLGLALSGPRQSGGWFDIPSGVLYRRGTNEPSTKKRRTPIRIPRQLGSHVRSWHKLGLTYACQWRDIRVGSVKTAWRGVVKDAQLGWNPTPHTLKHTAITWGMEAGMGITEAAIYYATSERTIRNVYWHLSPDYLADAVVILERRR